MFQELLDDDITVFKAQKDHVRKFTQIIQDFLVRSTTKKKFLMHDWHTQHSSTSDVMEILNSLMGPGTDIPWSENNEFMASKLFKTIFENINLLDHNCCDGGEKDMVFFESNTTAQIVELAGRMIEHEIGNKKSAIQFSCDFTQIPETDYMLGMCSIDDFKHGFWPTLFTICHTENGCTVRNIMGRMIDLINVDLRRNIDKLLIDGAHALRFA